MSMKLLVVEIPVLQSSNKFTLYTYPKLSVMHIQQYCNVS